MTYQHATHPAHFASRSSAFHQIPKCTSAQTEILIAEWREAHCNIPHICAGEAERHDAWARIQPASRILEKEQPYTGVIYHVARGV